MGPSRPVSTPRLGLDLDMLATAGLLSGAPSA
jgi:hypothetical protein